MNSCLQKACYQLQKSGLIILVDDAGTDTIGFLVGAAESISADDICFIVSHGRGVLLAPMLDSHLKQLHIPQMFPTKLNIGMESPEFGVSVDARHGITTGISADDRALTFQALAKTTDVNLDLVMPGHIFPIRAKNGGVLVRSGPSEAAVDLLKLSGITPVAALCHCLDSHGELLSESSLEAFATSHDLPLVRISDIMNARMREERFVEEVASANMTVKSGSNFKAIVFRSLNDDAEHLALVKGQFSDSKDEPILARVQAENRIEDLFGNELNSGRGRIHSALDAISKEGRGIFVYIRHPRTGKIEDQIRAIASNDSNPRNTAVLREAGIGSQILASLGATKVRLLTNDTRPISGVHAFGLEIVDRVPY